MFEQQVTFLYCQDLERSAVFYADGLGLPLVLDQGGCRIYRIGSDSFLGICRVRPGREVAPDGVIVTFVTQDVDGCHDRLKARNLPIEAPPRRNPDYGIYHFFLRDPDGYLLEVQRFESPDWPRPAS